MDGTATCTCTCHLYPEGENKFWRYGYVHPQHCSVCNGVKIARITEKKQGGSRMTHTYAVLEVSPEAYMEIRDRLKAADYEHAFIEDDGEEVIDMHGIALKAAVS